MYLTNIKSAVIANSKKNATPTSLLTSKDRQACLPACLSRRTQERTLEHAQAKINLCFVRLMLQRLAIA